MYAYSQIREKKHLLKVLPSNQVDLKEVKFVMGQEKSHLLFPMGCKKERKKEPWAVKTKLGWALSGSFPEHKTVQIATAFAASGNDQLFVQGKS